jgi:hypothetical protein
LAWVILLAGSRRIIEMQIRSVGIDLGKTTFHLVALGDNGKVLLKKKFTQKQLITFTANLQTSLIGLAEDVRFTCFSLGIQGVEGLFQPLFGGFTGINSASNPSGHGFRTPKKRGPDHRVPVISRAILDRLE